MAQLKTARVSANDLFANYPNQQGAIEADIATIFGYTPNVDITVAGVQLDNSGRVTSQALQSVAGTGTLGGPPGIGLAIWDSNANNQAVILQQAVVGGGSPQTFAIAPVTVPGTRIDLSLGPSVLEIDMSTGNLTGSTTQDMTQTPLVPQLPGVSNEYYNALGSFSQPGQLPFSGCRVAGIADTITAGNSDFLNWSRIPSNTFDVGGHFDGHTGRIDALTAGKYFVHVELPVVSSGGSSPINLTVTVTLIDDGANVVSKAFYNTGVGDFPKGQTSQYISLSTIWNASSGGSWIQVEVTNNGGQTLVCGTDPGIISSSREFTGSLSFFRIE